MATSECTADSLLAASSVGVAIIIMSAQRNRTQRMSQSAAIATCKMRNLYIQQVTEAVVMQNRNYSAEQICRWQHRGQ
jgi:hypothetical protein